jgi:hypothetical protein
MRVLVALADFPFLFSYSLRWPNIVEVSKKRNAAVIHVPNCKTPHTTAVVGATNTRESAERQPPDTILTRSRDRRDEQRSAIGETTRPPAP